MQGQAIVVAGYSEEGEWLGYWLRRGGLAVAVSREVERVLPTLAERPVDFLLLAPAGGMGLEGVVGRLRQITAVPLLLLLDPPTEEEHCRLLDAGVDLLLTRPCSPRILSRYVHRLLWRNNQQTGTTLPPLRLHGCTLDSMARTFTQHQHTVRLTQLEHRLLHTLMSHPGHLFSTDSLVEHVWGYGDAGNRGLVRGLVRRVRRKIEQGGEALPLIENVPAVGYRFVSHKL
jgi:DNA-binding response OmpR family regulator